MTDPIFSDRAVRRDGRIIARTPLRKSRSRRVRFIQQVTWNDCGPACLAMVLWTHGREIPLRQLREEMSATSDDLTAAGLKTVAERHGLTVRGLALEAEDLRELQMPAILHWEFRHFVVIERCTRKGAIIIDPTTCRRHIRFEQLAELFTGVALELTPSADFAPARDPRRHVTIRLLLAKMRRTLSGVFAISLLLQVLSLSVPAATVIVIDRVIPARAASFLPWMTAATGALAAFYFAVAFCRMRIASALHVRFDQEVTRAVVGRLIRLPLTYFQQRGTGEIVNRLTSIGQIRDLLGQQIVSVGMDGLIAAGYLIALLIVAPRLIGIAVAIAAVQAIVAAIASPKIEEAVHEQIAAQARSQMYLLDAVRGIQSVKVAGAEGNVLNAYLELYAAEMAATERRLRVAGVSDTLNAAAMISVPVLLLLAGAYAVLTRGISPGMMLASNAAAIGFLLPWTSFVTNAQRLLLVRRHIARIEDVLHQDIERTGTKTAPQRLREGVVFDNVTFGYDGGEPVVRNISFTVGPADFVAIVGRSGAGKSTVAKLLVGLYAADGIRVEGALLSEYDLPAFRRSVGTVFQESSVFADSIRNNIAFHCPELPLVSVIDAARIACVDDVIERLPLGYDTIVAETGTNFSGGQRQRLAIARAVAHRPSMLILDEATSELDGETEQRIYANLRALGVPMLVIAHRLSTIRDADRIVVIDGGCIVETGTHEELLRRQGCYYQLSTAQETGEGGR